jgi:hypothetical protein
MLSLLLARNARADDAPLLPKLDDRWWTIANSPDLGELTSDKQQPVDSAVWQAADGSWQLWSCVRGMKERGKTRLFYRWDRTGYFVSFRYLIRCGRSASTPMRLRRSSS